MTAPRRFTDAELDELKARNPCDQVAAQWVKLRRKGQRKIGPCPLHSPNPDARDSTSFECWPDRFVCAVCNKGGDVIKLVQLRENIDFVAAVERLGGVREIDPAEAARLEQERERKRLEQERNTAQFRERERGNVFGIWQNGTPIASTAVEAYLALRGLTAPEGIRLRCIAAMPYYADGARDAEVIHRGPAMLAPIVKAGKFSGLHITYIDLDGPKGKLALRGTDDEPLPAKKVRGSKLGGHIEIVGKADFPANRLVIGEGIEKVLAVWRAESARGEAATIYWTAVDLGNLGGRAAESVKHPTLKNAGGKAALKVPGPVPDLDAPGIVIPDEIDEIIILGDSTSDRFTTQCTIARAAARWARPGRRILVAWSPDGKDFDDLLRVAAPDELAVEQACRRIADIILAAQPVETSGFHAPQPESTSAGEASRPSHLPSPTAEPSAASAPPPVAAGASLVKKDQTSQAGASPDSMQAGAGGGGRNDDGETAEEMNRRLAWFPRTDLGNAERFVQRQRGTLMYCAAIGWLWWDGRRWAREGAEQRVKRAEHETVRAIQLEADALAKSGRDILIETKRDGTAVMLSDKLAAWGRASESNSKIVSVAKNAQAYLSVETMQLDADPFAINVQNGTIVIRREWLSGEGEGWRRYGDFIRLKPHDPGDLITKLAPVFFDPNALRPLFDGFLAEVQPDGAMRRFLQQWKGYSTTADSSEHRMCLFIGKGRNGKSVFEEITAHVAGDYAETVPIETFLASGREANANSPSPARALLHNARMVRTSEPNKGASLDEGFIKLVTGGEPIQARNLNLPMFRFYPVLKLTVSGNHRPKVGGTDEGIWSRVTLVPWSIIIPPEKRDRNLTHKLRAEASGIFNWMLDGLSDWIEHGLILPDEVTRATAEYRRDSDQLGRFLEVCVVTDPDGRVQSSVLLGVFNAWARANGGTEWTGRGLSNAMTERGFKKDKSSVMFWLGIKLTKYEGDFDTGGSPSRTDGGGRSSGARGYDNEADLSF